MTKRALAGLLAAIAGLAPAAAGPANPPPTELPGLGYEAEFFPGAVYDASVPTPASILGFEVGSRTATPEQIAECFRAWDKSSPRTRLVEYARTYEDRPLYYMIVTSPANLARIDEIKAGMGRLADPRELTEDEGARLVKELPVPAWMAYSIHGNESSGADASLALAYHLAAATNPEVTGMLDKIVVLIDPSMNPDGRARFVKQKAEYRGTAPNVDDQSLLHSGYWPWGRMNHYMFDLNRDWILGVNPETRGRIRAAGAWHPLLLLDAHEMGPQDTFLFSPAREPFNPNLPESARRWVELIARDEAAAFDKMGWLYYTGEWNENWYPGYSDSWAEYRGAAGILFEQARTAEDAVRLGSGSLRSYRESVHHQALASMTALRSLEANAEKMKREFLEDRRRIVGEESPYARRVFAVLPTSNRARIREFADLMRLQGFEIFEAGEEFTADAAIDQLGRESKRTRIRKGTILIPNRQPEGRLIAAMLEFDPRMPDKSVAAERKDLLKKGSSRIYDITAWNITMLQGLEAATLETAMPESAVPYAPARLPRPHALASGSLVVAYVMDGTDDNSVAVAARLMERGVKVRVADLPFYIDGHILMRGAIVVVPTDNRAFDADLAAVVGRSAEELDVEVSVLTTGMGEGELPDLGGSHFDLLEPPRIALMSRGGVSPYDFGSIWHALDTKLGIRHSHLDEQFFSSGDLRRYNVIVLPDRWFGSIPEEILAALKPWVEAGGTLIAIGGSAAAIAAEKPGISKVRTLPDALADLDEYRMTIYREWAASRGRLPSSEAVWSHALAGSPDLPWQGDSGAPEPSKEELQKRDDWEKIFMPQGAIVAGRIDAESWLAFGNQNFLPILVSDGPVLMAAGGVEAPVRLGYIEESDSPKAGEAAGAETGWARLPEGNRLIMRMSGLLWPEAARRLANSAWVTRERVGSGQVILFASTPVFRGAAAGTARVLLNAMIYGPGLGADHPIRP